MSRPHTLGFPLSDQTSQTAQQAVVAQLESRLDRLTRERAIEALHRASTSYAEALSALFKAKFTGAVTLHFAEGVPRSLDVANPVSVKLI